MRDVKRDAHWTLLSQAPDRNRYSPPFSRLRIRHSLFDHAGALRIGSLCTHCARSEMSRQPSSRDQIAQRHTGSRIDDLRDPRRTHAGHWPIMARRWHWLIRSRQASWRVAITWQKEARLGLFDSITSRVVVCRDAFGEPPGDGQMVRRI